MSQSVEKQVVKDQVSLSLKNWHGCDLNSFFGRLTYFTSVTAPHNSFYTSSTIKKYNENVKAVAAQADKNDSVSLTPQQAEEFQH